MTPTSEIVTATNRTMPETTKTILRNSSDHSKPSIRRSSKKMITIKFENQPIELTSSSSDTLTSDEEKNISYE